MGLFREQILFAPSQFSNTNNLNVYFRNYHAVGYESSVQKLDTGKTSHGPPQLNLVKINIAVSNITVQ